MNASAKDIVAILVAAGLGTAAASSGWSVHYAAEPEEVEDVTPATTITVYDTGSWRAPDHTNRLDYPTIQVRVRAATYDAGWTKALAIRDALLARPAETVNGTSYGAFWCTGDIAPLGRDNNDRFLFTVNFNLMREPSSGTHRS